MPAAPKLHLRNVWPWVVSQRLWQIAAEYREEPPADASDWAVGLVPLDVDGTVGARTRCGRMLPIDRFAPSNSTVTCERCGWLTALGESNNRDFAMAEPGDLPETLRYLRKCLDCRELIAPPDTRCVVCRL